MKAAIYTSTPVGDVGGVPAFNANAYPCHSEDTEIIFLNGNYPTIERHCLDQNLKVKPFSHFKKTLKKTSEGDE